MKNDINLRTKCIWVALISFLFLSAVVILKYVFFPSTPDLNNSFGWFIVIEICIWVSAGIASSFITLILTKFYDYRFKRDSAVLAYYYEVKTLYTNLLKIEPICMKNLKPSILSFKGFRPYFDNWKRIIESKTLMVFTKKDKNIEIMIDSINDAFKMILGPVFLADNMLQSKPIPHTASSINKDIFEIVPCKSFTEYIPKARTIILPLISDLEEKLIGQRLLENIDKTYSISYRI